MVKEHTNTILRFAAVVIAALLMTAFLVPNLAVAAPSDQKKAEAQAALEKLNALQAELDEASDKYFAAEEEREAAQAGMEAAQIKIDKANEQIEQLQAKLETRAVDMYCGGNLTYLDILFGSSSFKDFITSVDTLNQLNKQDADMVENTKALREQVQAEKEEYAAQESIAAEKAAEAKEVKDKAEALVADMQETYDNLSAEAAKLLEEEQAAAAAAAAAAVGIPVYGGSAPAYNVVTGNAIVDRAYSYIGKAEYVWGGCSPGAFDCSGFVSYCLTGRYARLGTTYTFLTWPAVSNPQPGDVCVNAGHCGIYIGNGQMIHCATYGVGVIIGPVQGGMSYHRY